MTGRRSLSSSIIPALNDLGEKIFQFFNNENPNTILNQHTYDDFFYDICDEFKNNYNTLAIASHIPTIEFGITQKLVNMSFKYLSCYIDYDDYADLFEFCHMPIDSYVLHYFNLNGVVRGIRSRFNMSMKYPVANYNGMGWSVLTLEAYQEIVNAYRISLSPIYPNNTFLQEEYYIWSYIRARTCLRPIVFNASLPLLHVRTMFFQ